MNPLFTFTALFWLWACSPPRQATFSSAASHQAKAGYANLYKSEPFTFVADQRDFLPQLMGTWFIHTMQRQAKLPEETLNINLQLKEDKTFVANTTCGDIVGNYSVKGVSIRFSGQASESVDCPRKQQTEEMLRLLTQTVSLYTVNGNMLFLKDNSGNNVFRITR